MDQNDISFQYKARYYKSGEINSKTKQIWFVLHGYGQLARFFLKKFSVLSDHNICVIAPEGLSKFYIENFEPGIGRQNDKVGATWMTKENRLSDIDNYIQYLNSIYDHEVQDRKLPVTVLGFSQGSATASRWVLNGHIKFERLILWAGLFPTDMNFENGKDILKGKKVLLIYGNKDPFLSDGSFAEMNLTSDKLSTPIDKIVFDGEHEIDQSTLLKLI